MKYLLKVHEYDEKPYAKYTKPFVALNVCINIKVHLQISEGKYTWL